MHWLLLPLGLAVVALVMWDALVTTLVVAESSGPVSGRVAHWLSEAALRTRRVRLVQTMGVVLTLAILLLWLVLLWTGWALIFNADPTAVVATHTGDPAGFWDRVYFAGTTLFTLGPGDFHPNGSGWQLATVAALLNGLGLASLGITYLIPVTAAATERRQLAATIASLGGRPDDVLITAWDGTSFQMLPQHLIRLGPELNLLSQRHLAYPVLHFFRSVKKTNAAATMIARLDEMLTLAHYGLADPDVLPKSASEPLQASLTQFLDTLRSAFIDPEDVAPPPPALHRLRAAGIPTVDDETFSRRVSQLDARRRLLVALVHSDAWEWKDVWPHESDDEDDPDRETPYVNDERSEDHA